MTLSATFTVDGNPVSGAVSVEYGAAVALALTSTSEVNRVEWTWLGSSLSSYTDPTITPAGTPPGATASYTQISDPTTGLGAGFLLQCRVWDSEGNYDTATALIGTENSAGLIPFCVSETFERSATHGWTEDFNSASQSLATILAAHAPVRTVAIENVANLASVTVATAFEVAVVEDDRVMLPNQTAAEENGVYVVGTVAAGSAPLTRASDFNTATNMVLGSLFAVQEGTFYQGEVFRFDTSGAIVVDTTPLDFNTLSGLVYGKTATLTAGAGATTLYTHACADDTLTTLAALITAEDTGGDTCHAASTMVVERQAAGGAVNKHETFLEPYYHDDAAWNCPDFAVGGNNATVAMTADAANNLTYKLWVWAWEHAI